MCFLLLGLGDFGFENKFVVVLVLKGFFDFNDDFCLLVNLFLFLENSGFLDGEYGEFDFVIVF